MWCKQKKRHFSCLFIERILIKYDFASGFIRRRASKFLQRYSISKLVSTIQNEVEESFVCNSCPLATSFSDNSRDVGMYDYYNYTNKSTYFQ